jgi:aquaporin Z
LKGFNGAAIGEIVGLDILFLAFISGASMNPAHNFKEYGRGQHYN